MLIILKTDYFQLWFFYNSDLRISTAGKHMRIGELKYFYVGSLNITLTAPLNYVIYLKLDELKYFLLLSRDSKYLL